MYWNRYPYLVWYMYLVESLHFVFKRIASSNFYLDLQKYVIWYLFDISCTFTIWSDYKKRPNDCSEYENILSLVVGFILFLFCKFGQMVYEENHHAVMKGNYRYNIMNRRPTLVIRICSINWVFFHIKC